MQTSKITPLTTDLSLTHVIQEEKGLQVFWSNGQSSFFHFIWLRDCCYCDKCGDSYSSKRFIVPSDIPLDIKPESVQVTATGNLAISWKSDDHFSIFDPDWLRQNSYDQASREARFQKPILWDEKISTDLPKVDFESACSTDEGLFDLFRKLRDFGFVVVTNGPTESGSVETVANLIGDLGDSAYTKIFDLTPSSKIQTMGNTTRLVPPHTDEAFRYAPPGVNVLSCVRPAETGGESILVDGFNISKILKKENISSFEMLSRYSQSYHRSDGQNIDQRARQRMIALDDRGEVIGVRIHTRSAGPLDLPSDLIEPYYAAHHHLSQLMMSPNNQARFKLDAGETVLFDNHRVLHARAQFSDPKRFMQICNVAREVFHERLRILARKLNFDEEANMILCSGMAY